MVYDNHGPIYSVLTGTKGSPCGTFNLTCVQMGPDPVNDAYWTPSNVDMNGCSVCDGSPITPNPEPTNPCGPLGATYTQTYYCA